VLDLNDYEMPIYSMDKEAKWHSTISNRFYNKLNRRLTCNLFAEHNGAYSAAFKKF
jgi:hypothetical protein